MQFVLCPAQSCFKDGTTWKSSYWGYGHGSDVPVFIMETVTLDGTETLDGHEAMKMYSTLAYGEVPDERVLVAYVRTDGDKIYFKLPKAENGEWYLMYDFGLQPGDDCYINNPSIIGNGNIPFKSYIKVTDVARDEQNGMDIIRFKEYKDESCDELSKADGEWIKGLSSSRGVNYPNGFGLDGGLMGVELLEVTCGGETIYKNTSTNIVNTENGTLKAKADGLTLHISGINTPCNISLFTTDGILCKQMTAADSHADIALPDYGVYILKIGNMTMKIATTR